jgi:hypothetical protein
MLEKIIRSIKMNVIHRKASKHFYDMISSGVDYKSGAHQFYFNGHEYRVSLGDDQRLKDINIVPFKVEEIVGQETINRMSFFTGYSLLDFVGTFKIRSEGHLYSVDVDQNSKVTIRGLN